ncbi:uncharacterized protein GGS22DRAFT_61008 [Annulohypoxylon maeteangense]|uniref:uncharacterized protein n=1 Tax=Annulohypoxylon maeteangense TaxID=1927788 RepID=UPI0020079AF9|nr:uncharacterized protein GGS22DRAFT_61008 [Annulohypoxylon maeteangense]KAI0888606.1 hypothetical protein GGS22DRAFT_61008 [Annulohypoxylon maeteangense]
MTSSNSRRQNGDSDSSSEEESEYRKQLDRMEKMLGDDSWADDNHDEMKRKFIMEFGSIVGKPSPEDEDQKKNILHILASKKSRRFHPMIQWMIGYLDDKKYLNQLLRDGSDAEAKPLTSAIKNKNITFIKAILKSKTAELGDVLGDYVENRRNCIHYIFKKNIPAEISQQLIEKASEDTLAAQDVDGATPLHMAAEISSSSKGNQLDTVRTFLKYGDKALDRYRKAGGYGSVYQRFQESLNKRNKYENQNELASGKVENDIESWPSQDTSTKYGQDESKDEKERNKSQAQKEMSRKASGRKIYRENDFQPSSPNRVSTFDSQTSAQYQPNEGRRVDVPKNSNSFEIAPQNSAQTKYLEKAALEVKLHYLRTTLRHDSGRTHDDAKKFLYGPNEKDHKHISFPFREGPPTLSRDVFKATYDDWVFDTALQSVAVRRLVFGGKDADKKVTKTGRRDMEFLFNWLRGKGVRHIIKVIVLDQEFPAHSDESIELALKDFNIEVLDWRKTDLCPGTIRIACPGVTELHVWWSGNNGILRAWSAPDGLAKLENLKDVYIRSSQSDFLDSPDRVDANIKAFKDALETERIKFKEWPAITVHVPDFRANRSTEVSSNTAFPPNLVNPTPSAGHDWLKTMDRFVGGMKGIALDTNDKSIPMELRGDVKIALIDDGVELTDRMLTGCIYDGWSCNMDYEGNDYYGIKRSYGNSTTQHGTLMASMIRRVCPRAKIFVFRLEVTSDEGKRAHFTAKSAAEAVEKAANGDFDIISMSWTVKIDSKNKRDTDRLSESLGKAGKKGKLMFCAVPDSGDKAAEEIKQFLPVGCVVAGTKIFKIGASKADGSTWFMSGLTNTEFSLPGHEVDKHTSSQIRLEKEDLKTGSSISTSLAAGLAALILTCLRIGAISRYKRDKKDFEIIKPWVTKFRGTDAMKDIFTKMASQGESNKYIHVWSTFGSASETLKKLDFDIKEKKEQLEDDPENKNLVSEIENLQGDQLRAIENVAEILFHLAT